MTLVAVLSVTAVGTTSQLVELSREKPAPREIDAFAPARGSVSYEARTPGPGGEAPWLVRFFVTDRGGYRCPQAGQLVDGKFGISFPSAPMLKLEFADSGGPACANGNVTVLQALEDPNSSQPRVRRSAVFGVLASSPDSPGPRQVRVTAGKQTQTVGVSRRGAWLAVFEGPVRSSELSAAVVSADGAVRQLKDPASLATEAQPIEGSAAIAARTADPQGGSEFGLLRWLTSEGRTCLAYGRVVGQDVGRFPLPGIFVSTADLAGGDTCVKATRGSQQFTIGGGTLPAKDGQDGTGYVFVYGIADPTTVRALLIEPSFGSPVQLRPSSNGAYLGVLSVKLKDPFAERLADRYNGSISVIALHDDGTRRRVPLVAGLRTSDHGS